MVIESNYTVVIGLHICSRPPEWLEKFWFIILLFLEDAIEILIFILHKNSRVVLSVGSGQIDWVYHLLCNLGQLKKQTKNPRTKPKNLLCHLRLKIKWPNICRAHSKCSINICCYYCCCCCCYLRDPCQGLATVSEQNKWNQLHNPKALHSWFRSVSCSLK